MRIQPRVSLTRPQGFEVGMYLPRDFPEHCAWPGWRIAPDSNRQAFAGLGVDRPLGYGLFAFLFRPLLTAKFETRQLFYRKIAPIAVLCDAHTKFAPLLAS